MNYIISGPRSASGTPCGLAPRRGGEFWGQLDLKRQSVKDGAAGPGGRGTGYPPLSFQEQYGKVIPRSQPRRLISRSTSERRRVLLFLICVDKLFARHVSL